MRILFASGNVMSARTLRTLFLTLQERNRHVSSIATEGAGTAEWDAMKTHIVAQGVEGTPWLDMDQIFWNHPEVVVVGTSSPIGMELEIAYEAKNRGIPLVVFPDIWGAGSRIEKCPPDLVLAIDAIAAKIEQERFPNARVVVAGDPALAGFSNFLASERFTEVREALERYDLSARSLLLVGQGKGCASEDIVDWVVDSVALTFQETGKIWTIVPRLLHPDPKKQDLDVKAHWEERIQVLPKGAIIELPRNVAEGGFTTDELALTFPVTVTGYSTPLRGAALAGEMGISIETPGMITAMRRELGDIEGYPLIEFGATLGVTSPQNLDNLFIMFSRDTSLRSRLYGAGAKWIPQVAVEAIESFAS